MSQFDRCAGEILPRNSSVPVRGAVCAPCADCHTGLPHRRTDGRCSEAAEVILTNALSSSAVSSSTAARVKNYLVCDWLRVRGSAVEQRSAPKPAPLLCKEPLLRQSSRAIAPQFTQVWATKDAVTESQSRTAATRVRGSAATRVQCGFTNKHIKRTRSVRLSGLTVSTFHTERKKTDRRDVCVHACVWMCVRACVCFL